MPTAYSTNPYLYFTGQCAEAIEFYGKTVGAHCTMMMRYKEMPPEAQAQVCVQPGQENWICHARLLIGDSILMMADGPTSGKFSGFSISLAAPSPEDAQRVFAALSEGGKVDMPLQQTFYSPAFGMLTDRFGVQWMVIVEPGA